ncbi:uncharacterized protein [Rutidosis leptorrhynchoides]|uniref:uncharacterized protein n=1 Tax=Rutidosis leptorrhynchoides TaxID=125765 RepID=UPI003A99826B
MEKVDSHVLKVGFDLYSSEWFADKRILIRTGGNIRNLMKLLKCFALTSGLKVNFQKSNLIGIGVEKNEVESMARLFNCNVGTTPFLYLGLPVGGNMKKEESWDPVVKKIEKRLSDWRARTVSLGRRLTLVKSVLNSLPLYYFLLSFSTMCD